MKSLVFLLVCVVALVCASVASACPVATVSAFAAPVVVQSHCGVATVQSVQPVAVQAFAIPTVAVLQAPIVVQNVHHQNVRQQRVFSRSVVRTRTVVR